MFQRYTDGLARLHADHVVVGRETPASFPGIQFNHVSPPCGMRADVDGTLHLCQGGNDVLTVDSTTGTMTTTDATFDTLTVNDTVAVGSDAVAISDSGVKLRKTTHMQWVRDDGTTQNSRIYNDDTNARLCLECVRGNGDIYCYVGASGEFVWHENGFQAMHQSLGNLNLRGTTPRLYFRETSNTTAPTGTTLQDWYFEADNGRLTLVESGVATTCRWDGGQTLIPERNVNTPVLANFNDTDTGINWPTGVNDTVQVVTSGVARITTNSSSATFAVPVVLPNTSGGSGSLSHYSSFSLASQPWLDLLENNFFTTLQTSTLTFVRVGAVVTLSWTEATGTTQAVERIPIMLGVVPSRYRPSVYLRLSTETTEGSAFLGITTGGDLEISPTYSGGTAPLWPSSTVMTLFASAVTYLVS